MFSGLSTAAEGENPLLFYASFDRNALAEQAFGDETPLVNQNLKILREGRKGGALILDSDSILSYDAPGNLYAERGTVTFWWKLDDPLDEVPFSIVRISLAQPSTPDSTFGELQWSGERLRLWFRDRDSVVHSLTADEKGKVTAGRWYHLAFTWDELDGLRLYLDGRMVSRKTGELHLASSLDQIGFHLRSLAPSKIEGNGRKAYLDELRLYSIALAEKSIEDLAQQGGGRAGQMPPVSETSPELWNSHWKARFGWHTPEQIPPVVTSAVVHKISFLEGTDSRKLDISSFDGKPETYWPSEYPGYAESGKSLTLNLAEEPFNWLLLEGNFVGRINQGNDLRKVLLERSESSGTAGYLALKVPVTGGQLQVSRKSGVIRELSAFNIQAQSAAPSASSGTGRSMASKIAYRLLPRADAANLDGVSRGQINSLYNLDLKISRRYLPVDRESWVGVPAEIYKAPERPSVSASQPHYSHVIVPPFLQHTALDAVRLRFNVEGKKPASGALVHVTVRDPLLLWRDLLTVDLRLRAEGPSEVVLDFPDIVVPAGIPLWITLAGDRKDFGADYLTGAEVELWLAETGTGPRAERSKKEYLAQRLNQLRADFFLLSMDRCWVNADPAKLRQQFRLVDELYRLVEDVLRTDPKEPTALAFRGWLQPGIAPPDYKQLESPLDIPLWAFQQQSLVNQFRELAGWWIKSRQAAAGEFGDGLDQDTTLVSNWPGIALMEGPDEELRSSLRLLLESCYRTGALKDGLNAALADPQHAYRQGLGLAPASALLEYGNPSIIERLMESTRHYERLTGVNAARHRHFQSLLFSATQLLDEPLYGREDPHSVFMWQPGLVLAWYNGNPGVMKQITEHADALLAHWQKEKYPLLTRGVRFVGDTPLSRGLPDPEVVDFLWAVYRLTGNSKYLSLFDRMSTMGDVGLVETMSGRWLDFVEPEVYRDAVEEQARKKTIWDRNLQGDESGLLARQLSYEISGDKKLVEDNQAALLKHLAQNGALYTVVQPATGSIRLLTRTLQRERLGGVASYNGTLFPGHAVSWEGTRGNISALVLKATPDYLKIAAFNMAKTFQDVNLRVWNLENGTYEVFEGTDLNDDDKVDILTTKRTLSLKRYSIVPLTLRARKTTIIEIRQFQKGTPLSELPDLAMGPEDLQFDPVSETGRLVVHNIGARKSPAFSLQVENEKRVVLLKKSVEGLEAPVDCQPKTTVIDLSGLHTRGSRLLFFRINPERAFEEITEENNLLRKTY